MQGLSSNFKRAAGPARGVALLSCPCRPAGARHETWIRIFWNCRFPMTRFLRLRPCHLQILYLCTKGPGTLVFVGSVWSCSVDALLLHGTAARTNQGGPGAGPNLEP
jgi:hypothetical protein